MSILTDEQLAEKWDVPAAQQAVAKWNVLHEADNHPAWKAIKGGLLAEAKELSEEMRATDMTAPGAPMQVLKLHAAWLARFEVAHYVDDAKAEFEEATRFLDLIEKAHEKET